VLLAEPLMRRRPVLMTFVLAYCAAIVVALILQLQR
jgi:hypothetical protein